LTDTPSHDIAIVISHLGSGGSQMVVSTLANAWVGRGLRVCVITLAAASEDFYFLDAGVSRMILGSPGRSASVAGAIAANIGRLSRLRRAIREAHAPVVVAFVGAVNILTVIATRGLGLNVVISERNDPARQSLGRGWNFLRRIVYPWADLVTANSRGAVVSLGRFVPDKKLAYAPNPLRLDGRAMTGRKDTKVVLAVGRLARQKGYDILLQSFAKILASAGNWRLVIAGEGDLRQELASNAARMGIENRVDWLGPVADIAQCYANADIFVSASRYEGTPNALIEAMSFGLPVVVTDASPGPLELVENGVTGLVCRYDNVNALADTLSRLIEDPGLRETLGAAGREKVEPYGLESVLKVWGGLLNLPDGIETVRDMPPPSPMSPIDLS